MTDRSPSAPRCAVLVGPYLSGKTTLLESLLHVTGATSRKGSVRDGTSVGDPSPEARSRQMTVETTAATTTFLGENWTFLDCPGSIEFGQDGINCLMVADIAVVVCEPSPERALMLAPLLKFLDAHDIPHVIFVNKMDNPTDGAPGRVSELMAALQGVSERPLVLRQVPLREEGVVHGYVDLVSERAYHYKPGQPSDLIPLPGSILEREKAARQEMLEALADFDDTLLEELLEDIAPSKEEIYANLARDLRDDLIVPVFLGAAENDHGVRRLLKALRHEAPPPEATLERLGLPASNGEPLAQVFKTVHAAHTGKLSYVRVWRGPVTDGMTLDGNRISGVFRPVGAQLTKVAQAGTGEVVALGRLDSASTGDILAPSGVKADWMEWPKPMRPLFAQAIGVRNHADEVKLTAALAKLCEEDPSLSYEMNADTGQLLLWGQGEIHLMVALDRLRSRYNLDVAAHAPRVPYKETIRKGTTQHSRFKRQSGGHGQFADVTIDIKPLPRGSGFAFTDTIVGGVVPKQYIPAVEEGVREYLGHGPLGFPVVDIAVTLTNGQFHSVDSSDQAFKTAARIAMTEALPTCDPVLLEPIFQVEISVPNEFTSKVQRVLTGRRGQILGYDAKPDWPGWDTVTAYLPQAEMHDLIVELRSATQGTGSFDGRFDHLQELTGKLADRALQTAASAAQ